MPFVLHSYAGAQELARDVACRWLDLLRNSATATPFTVALSGGRIPKLFYGELVLAAERQRLDAVHFFWGDERCVPPDDDESNYKLAAEHLFTPLELSVAQIHRLQVERGEEFAVAEGESQLRRFTQVSPSGQPVFDLILLGMGEDGHIASLFPNESEELITRPAVYRAVTGPKPPPRRLTLGYPAIASARQVWVLASGSGKEAALKKSISGNGDTPLARVLRLRESTDIFTDIPLD